MAHKESMVDMCASERRFPPDVLLFTSFVMPHRTLTALRAQKRAKSIGMNECPSEKPNARTLNPLVYRLDA